MAVSEYTTPALSLLRVSAHPMREPTPDIIAVDRMQLLDRIIILQAELHAQAEARAQQEERIHP